MPNTPKRGASIAYAEVDGIPVCLDAAGGWCEREAGHEGPHVIAPLVARDLWDAALPASSTLNEGTPT